MIAEIALALAFVILMVFMFNGTLGIGRDANNRVSAIKDAVVNAELEKYNGKIVSGDTVISTINKLQTSSDGVKMTYGVCKSTTVGTTSNWEFFGVQAFKAKSGTTAKEYFDGSNTAHGYLTASTKQAYKKYDLSKTVGSTGYISPVKEYTSKLVFNQNGVLIGIVFIVK